MAADELNIAEHYMQAWSAGKAAIVDEMAAPDLTVSYTHFPAPIQGARNFKAVLAQTHQSFPDLQLTIDAMIDAGEQVVVRWHYRGTHRAGEVLGIAPRGKTVRVDGLTILHIHDHKVIAETGIVDNFSLLQQLRAANT
jgi:steroid delta-isomerase-like uncharacterized protein